MRQKKSAPQAHLCGGCRMESAADAGICFDREAAAETACAGTRRRRAWMRRARSLASSGSSQRRLSKSHVPAELRSWHRERFGISSSSANRERFGIRSGSASRLSMAHDSRCARAYLTMHCMRTRTRRNPRDSRCLFSSGSEIPFLLGW
jgi:hypothetical protein